MNSSSAPTWGVVIVAAGQGKRMGTAISKQYLELLGKPILVHTLERFAALSEVAQIVVVTGANDVPLVEQYVKQYAISKVGRIVVGGAERQHSVLAGLRSVETSHVLVHDAVRPLVTAAAIRRCMNVADRTDAAVLAVPVKDTIKQVDATGVIVSTPDRSSLWAIQTPQAFRRSLLLGAHERAVAEAPEFIGTDDAVVVERFGGTQVSIAEGDYTNMKITTPEDLPYATFLLNEQLEGNGQHD